MKLIIIKHQITSFLYDCLEWCMGGNWQKLRTESNQITKALKGNDIKEIIELQDKYIKEYNKLTRRQP